MVTMMMTTTTALKTTINWRLDCRTLHQSLVVFRYRTCSWFKRYTNKHVRVMCKDVSYILAAKICHREREGEKSFEAGESTRVAHGISSSSTRPLDETLPYNFILLTFARFYQYCFGMLWASIKQEWPRCTIHSCTPWDIDDPWWSNMWNKSGTSHGTSPVQCCTWGWKVFITRWTFRLR